MVQCGKCTTIYANSGALEAHKIICDQSATGKVGVVVSINNRGIDNSQQVGVNEGDEQQVQIVIDAESGQHKPQFETLPDGSYICCIEGCGERDHVPGAIRQALQDTKLSS